MITNGASHSPIYSAAHSYRAAGINVGPLLVDGSKAAATKWKPLETAFATDAQLAEWFDRRRLGIAVICGKISGSVEVLDVDAPELCEPFRQEVERIAPGLMGRLTIHETGGGGWHIPYRCSEIGANQKLAQRLGEIDPDTGEPKVKTTFETRGEGGYIVAPGSPLEVHDSRRPYRHISGPPITSLPTITPEERETLHRVARSFHELPEESREHQQQTKASSPRSGGLTPGDDFNRRASWGEILEPAGWKLSHASGPRNYWARPGKDGRGWSATTGNTSQAGNELLCVFSSNANPFEVPYGKPCGSYSKFAAFALLNHSGDFSAAARDLAQRGYGDKIDTTGISSPEDAAAWLADGKFLANAMRTQAEGDAAAETFPVPMAAIKAHLFKRSDGWPRRVDTMLFVDDRDHGLCALTKSAALFGWIHQVVGKVLWYGTVGCVTRDEFFAELQRTARAYRAIEAYPHFPRFADHYYSHPEFRPGNGAALRGLLDLFCPETPIDRDLIMAMIATALWGGEGGTRPAFVIVSDAGRGVGKSKLVELLGRLVGGMFAVSKDDKAPDIIKRLLTAEAATKRLVLIDNVKSNRLSWADLESLITCPAISGHKLYAGERTRPNTLLWAITVNGPSLSRDLAQRSVVIKLAKPQHSGDWEDGARAYVDRHRWAIIADVAAFFQQPAEQLVKNSRWGSWEKDVLARLPEPADAQRVIAERQDAINADDEEMRDVEEYFEQRLAKLGYNQDADAVHIPGDVAARWFNEATHSNHGRVGAIRAMKQAVGEGLLKRLQYNTSKREGVARGMVWRSLANPGAEIQYDLEQTIENARVTATGADYWDR